MYRHSMAAILLAASGMSASPALAQDSGLARCLAIAEIAARVACYDAIARAEQAGQAPAPPAAVAPAPPAPAAVAPTAPAPAATPALVPPVAAAATPEPTRREEFGLSAAAREEKKPVEERQLNEITAVVASARTIGAGYWQFAMRDGSVWRLTETRASFRAPEPGDTVVLRRASLGSYLLDADSQPSIRVKRVG